MDRIRPNLVSGIPPGFNGDKFLTRVSPDMAPVFIPHGHAIKSIPCHNGNRQSTPIAASAPAETIPYMNMLFHNSTERRSLSPCNRMASTRYGQPSSERVRVLSCSDLESALTARLHEGPRIYQEYQSPASPFSHLPPIQACSPPQHAQHHLHRMVPEHDFQPLNFGCSLPGQQIIRKGHTPIRPPPGFEVPLLTPPSSPLKPAQHVSPQPWSPARLAPMFYKNERSRQKEAAGVEVKTNMEIKTGALKGHDVTLSHKAGGDQHIGSMKKRLSESKIDKFEQSRPYPGPSSQLEFKPEILERGVESDRSNGRKMSNEAVSPGKKKEKKKKPKKEKRKSKTFTGDSCTEKLNESTETSTNNEITTCVTEIDETDNCGLKNGKLQSRDQNTNETSLEKEKEKLKKLKKKFKKQKKVEKFEQYLPLDDVKIGLADKALIEAEIRINQKNYKEAYISDPEDGQDIIIVGLKDRNRSLDGDIVVVKLHDEADSPEQKKGKTYRSGKVVFIKERVHHRCTVGALHMIDKGMVLLVPRDQRFPLLRIRPQSIPLNLLENLSSTNIENVLFKATLISWDITRYAYGIIMKKVGKKGELDSETAAIFDELGLDREPVPDSHKYLPPLPYQIQEEELSSRLDLRSEVIFTIDPPTARDLDDAVSIKKLSDDIFQVGVHISDVTHFLQEGTKLDKIISQRATTVYMVDEAYHMLPVSLCGLCSLNSGEDKLTVSVIMTINKNGILDKEFRRSVIHSCAQLTYDQVQDVIDGKDTNFPEIHNNVQFSDIKDAVLQLHELASHFRKKRFDGGALKIDQPKLWFTLDADNMPNSLAVYEIKDSHRLIEEFMLLANESVARFIHDKAPDIALLRRHDPPKQQMMMRVEKSLNEIGIVLNCTSAGNLHTSLSKYCDEDEMKAHVLYHLCARPMKRAVYFCSSPETHHYALNMEKYTHFTSPIRRYADIIVHRILTACLDLSPMPPWDTQQINRFASVCNRKKYSAKRASEMSCDLFRTFYVKKVGSLTVDAVVVSVCSHFLNVIVPSLAYNTRISLEERDDIKFEFVDEDMNSVLKIQWPGEIQEVKIFSCVQVMLIYNISKTLTPLIQTVLLPPSRNHS